MKQLGFEFCVTEDGREGVAGDGNCQFYSLSWVLFQSISKHAELRSDVVDYLRGDGRAEFEVFYAPEHPSLPSTYDDYLDYMAEDFIWGDHLTLQAAANILNSIVRVLTAEQYSDSDTPVLTLSPQNSESSQGQKVVWLGFAAQHYSPIQ